MKYLFILVLFIPMIVWSQSETFQFSDKKFELEEVYRTNFEFRHSCWGPNMFDYPFLDSIKDFLETNDSLHIEIGCRTDYRGSQKANAKLSEGKARAVYLKLLEIGVDSNRLDYKGYGEYQLLISEKEILNMKSNEEKDKALKINRRLELKIIRIKND